MRVLIVYAHPEPHSFNGALKDLAVEVLTQAGHQVRVSDLYAMHFQPTGGPGDFTTPSLAGPFRYQAEQAAAKFTPELQSEIDKVAWCDMLIFQCPMWWFSLPAILKGWVDRVFAFGFAYDRSCAYDTGLFRGKRAMLSLTTGSPAAAFGPQARHGSIEDLLLHVNRGMFYFVGMEVLPPFVAYGAPRGTPEERAGYLKAYRERLLTIDSTVPLYSTAASAAV
jgi:NAD(P)H dehydrogenase (quinone)